MGESQRILKGLDACGSTVMAMYSYSHAVLGTLLPNSILFVTGTIHLSSVNCVCYAMYSYICCMHACQLNYPNHGSDTQTLTMYCIPSPMPLLHVTLQSCDYWLASV